VPQATTATATATAAPTSNFQEQYNHTNESTDVTDKNLHANGVPTTQRIGN